MSSSPGNGAGAIEYQPGLDGLRGVSVLLVLVFHSGLGWLPGGFLGVSTFFTLSGFLITALLVTEYMTNGRIDLPQFWERRFRRLLPAALMTIVVVSISARWLSTDVEQSRLRGDAIASVFYVSNWRSIVSQLSYKDVFSTSSPLIHMWSLSIEEQMYLIVPLVITATLAILGRRGAATTAAVLALASTATAVWALEGDRLYYGTDARAAELLVGVVAAVLIGPQIVSGKLAVGKVLGGVPLVGMAGILLLARTTSTDSPWVYDGFLVAFSLVSLVCVIGAIVPGPLRIVLSTRPLVVVGKVSYGLYLFHWPIFTWMNQQRLGFGGVALFVVQLSTTALVAAASYKFVEQPIRRRRILAGRRTFVFAVVGAMAVATAVPLLALEAVTTTPSDVVRVLSTIPTAGSSDDGHGGPVMSPSAAIRVLVIGDSTAENVATALAATGKIGVVSAGVLGCPVVQVARVYDRPRGSQETSYCPDNVEILRSNASRVDVVFVVGGVSDQWSYAPLDGAADDAIVAPGSSRYRQDYDTAMADFQAAVAPWGIPIVVLDNPRTRPDEAVLGDEPEAHDAWRSQIERWDETWESVARISIDDRLAPPDSPEGRRQRPDGVHFEEGFAQRLAADVLVPRLIATRAALIDHLDEVGCRIESDQGVRLDLSACRSTPDGVTP